MTTHKSVTEADIAAALARVLRGTNYVPFAEVDDVAATIATRLFAALPEPEPTAREDGLREASLGPEPHRFYPGGLLSTVCARHDCMQAPTASIHATSSRPAAPEKLR